MGARVLVGELAVKRMPLVPNCAPFGNKMSCVAFQVGILNRQHSSVAITPAGDRGDGGDAGQLERRAP